jgi:glyoxylate reductase
MKPKVVVTRKVPERAIELLAPHCELDVWPEEDTPISRQELERKIRDADGLYCLLTETVDRALLEMAPRLRVVSNMAVGYNNIDVAEATRRGIMVTNTPDVLTETTADLTFALLMATARRIVEAERFLRRGEWRTWSPMLLTGQDIYGATMGIIGLGRIGSAVARRGIGFNMRVLYHSTRRNEQAERELGVQYAGLDELLRESDFVVVMTPLTPQTRNLIGARELALMKPTAVLINTARGGVVDERALYDALKNGQIWAAGLDVFEQEPVPTNHPLLSLPNVTALPHIGSASIRTRIRMAELAAENLLDGLAGRVPKCLVNREVAGMQ